MDLDRELTHEEVTAVVNSIMEDPANEDQRFFIYACLWDSIQEMWTLDEYNEYFSVGLPQAPNFDTSEEE